MTAITLLISRDKALFQPGVFVATQGAMVATTHAHRIECLTRHLSGDWGCVCDEDKALNDEAVKDGSRLLSAYPIDPEQPSCGFGKNTFWIITEADRSVTTFLLPDEY